MILKQISLGIFFLVIFEEDHKTECGTAENKGATGAGVRGVGA